MKDENRTRMNRETEQMRQRGGEMKKRGRARACVSWTEIGDDICAGGVCVSERE